MSARSKRRYTEDEIARGLLFWEAGNFSRTDILAVLRCIRAAAVPAPESEPTLAKTPSKQLLLFDDYGDPISYT